MTLQKLCIEFFKVLLHGRAVISQRTPVVDQNGPAFNVHGSDRQLAHSIKDLVHVGKNRVEGEHLAQLASRVRGGDQFFGPRSGHVKVVLLRRAQIALAKFFEILNSLKTGRPTQPGLFTFFIQRFFASLGARNVRPAGETVGAKKYSRLLKTFLET